MNQLNHPVIFMTDSITLHIKYFYLFNDLICDSHATTESSCTKIGRTAGHGDAILPTTVRPAVLPREQPLQHVSDRIHTRDRLG